MKVFYSLFFVNMLVQVVVFVPTMLINERFEGSVMAIFAGVLVGTVLLVLFVRSIGAFPGQTLPDILAATSRWFHLPFLALLCVTWFSAGLISLLSINNMAIRFINVSFQGPAMILVFSIFILWIMLFLGTPQILALVSVVLILNLPLIGIIFYQATRNEYIMWSSVLEVGTYWAILPSYKAITASSFMFTGYTNLVVFNKLIHKPVALGKLWIVPIIALLNLLTSVAVPIGLHGADGVNDYMFPWVVTADSLQIQYGPIERLISVFLLLYVSISTISILIHWHVCHQLFLSMFKPNPRKPRKQTYLTYGLLLSFLVTTYLVEKNTREYEIFRFAEHWMMLRLPAEILLVMTLVFMARRRKA
ncbi:hypothetical protein WMW72_29390 [Paenibacillus filicis]|uniref:Spore germination protein n=1 Tax=Paenibacillus filicis TaxID=669464 RepID=A0ABU9DUW0_9BACL